MIMYAMKNRNLKKIKRKADCRYFISECLISNESYFKIGNKLYTLIKDGLKCTVNERINKFVDIQLDISPVDWIWKNRKYFNNYVLGDEG